MISCCSPKVVYQADSTKRIYCDTKLPLGAQSCRRCPIIWAVDFNSHCVLKAQQNNSGGKIPTPLRWPFPLPPPQALLVYLHSKLKIWITSPYCLPKHSSCQALGCLHLYYLNLMLIMFFIYKEQAFTLPVWGYAVLMASTDLAQGRGRGGLVSTR